MNNQDQLAILRSKMESCDKCGLCESRTQVVFGEGKTDSPKLMLIGEACGFDEDQQGKPFVGRAGQKLDKIIQYLEIPRNEIYITNACLCRPENNRTPLIEEIQACRWRLMAQIHLIQPKLIGLMGKTAITSMLGTEFKGPLNQFFNNDKWLEFEIEGKIYPTFVTFHPAFLLRQPKYGYEQSLPHWKKVKEFIHHV